MHYSTAYIFTLPFFTLTNSQSNSSPSLLTSSGGCNLCRWPSATNAEEWLSSLAPPSPVSAADIFLPSSIDLRRCHILHQNVALLIDTQRYKQQQQKHVEYNSITIFFAKHSNNLALAASFVASMLLLVSTISFTSLCTCSMYCCRLSTRKTTTGAIQGVS